MSLALGVLLVYYVLLYLIDPILVVKGILWKIIFIVTLVYGLTISFEEQKLKKKYNFLKDKKK